jgi:tRNA/rRNA methyltransferase
MSGTDLKNKRLIAEGPAIILCEPQLGQNIGMVARAMANFGLVELRLVTPRDGWPNEHAIRAASGAIHIVEGASVHDSLGDAIGDLNFVIATTARPRDMIKPVREPDEAAVDLRRRFAAGEKAGILFGRERWGLNNDEIALCDEIVTFPVNPAFASLNIAQAVLLVSYEWMKTAGENPAIEAFEQEARPVADRVHLIRLMDHLEGALDEAGYFFPVERRERMAQTVRNIFTHMKLNEQEIQTLRGVIAALEGRRRHKMRSAARNAPIAEVGNNGDAEEN